MSTSSWPTRFSTETGTARPLMRAVERPLAPISRRRISAPSSSSRTAWSRSSAPIGPSSSSSVMIASTRAMSAPLRTISALTRPPSTAPTASMMMLLPAPVSPVSTLKPGAKRTARRSMMAKLVMLSSSSIGTCKSTQPQLAQQRLVEVVALLIAQEAGDMRADAHCGHVAVAHGHVLLSIDAEGRLVVGVRGELDDRVRRHHDRAAGMGVSADRREDEAVHLRVQDRAARRVGIGRGAGRRGDQDAVRRVGGQLLVVQASQYAHDPRQRATSDHGLVEGLISGQALALAPVLDLQHDALLDPVVAAHEWRDPLGHLGGLTLRTQTQRTQVDAQHGRARECGEARGAQDGAIAAQRNGHVDV